MTNETLKRANELDKQIQANSSQLEQLRKFTGQEWPSRVKEYAAPRDVLDKMIYDVWGLLDVDDRQTLLEKIQQEVVDVIACLETKTAILKRQFLEL